MLIETRANLPGDLTVALTIGLLGRTVEFNDNRYRIDTWNSLTQAYQARRAHADGRVVDDTVTETIYLHDIERIVIY